MVCRRDYRITATTSKADIEGIIMKTVQLMTIATLTTTVIWGTVQAQGNPHKDMLEMTSTMAGIQGNPHIGFEEKVLYVDRYQGNPHEGYISRVVRVANSGGNPHQGFKVVPLTVASSE
jgi:hypothetical protein